MGKIIFNLLCVVKNGAGILFQVVFALGILFAIYVLITGARLEREGQKEMSAIKDISSNDVVKIDIFEDENNELISSIDSREIIEQFCLYIREIEPWKPDHPRFVRCFYVKLYEDERIYEFEMCLKELPEKTVFIYGVRSENKRRVYPYRAKSDSLYDWFIANDLIE